MQIQVVGPGDEVLAQRSTAFHVDQPVLIPRAGDLVSCRGERWRVREIEWQLDPIELIRGCCVWVEAIP